MACDTLASSQRPPTLVELVRTCVSHLPPPPAPPSVTGLVLNFLLDGHDLPSLYFSLHCPWSRDPSAVLPILPSRALPSFLGLHSACSFSVPESSSIARAPRPSFLFLTLCELATPPPPTHTFSRSPAVVFIEFIVSKTEILLLTQS